MIPFHRSFYCSIFGLKNTESKCRRIFFRLLLLLQKQNEYLSNEWTSLGALRQFRNDKMKNKVENFLQKKEILTQKKSWKKFLTKRGLCLFFSFLFFVECKQMVFTISKANLEIRLNFQFYELAKKIDSQNSYLCSKIKSVNIFVFVLIC